MQLTRGGAALAWAAWILALAGGSARADNEIELRSVYYKEKATRVVQPMLDVSVDVTPEVAVDGHLLLDAITSASVASGTDGEAFTENRFEGGAGADVDLGVARVGGFGRVSREPGYRSIFGGVRATAALFQKNTTVGAVVALGTDHVTNAGARFGMTPVIVEGDMGTVLVSLSASQILSPALVAGVTYDHMRLSGFLENPYRPVFGGGMRVDLERVPDSRVRHAVAGSVRWYVAASRTTVIGSYRLYTDDWDVLGHTPEVRVVQRLAPDFDVHLRYQYHRQSAAYFFERVYATLDPALEPYVTEDIKLSAFDSHILGAKVDTALANLGFVGRAGKVRADIVLNYVIQNNRFGNALVLQAGVAIPFDE